MKNKSLFLAILIIVIIVLFGCDSRNQEAKKQDIAERPMKIGLSFDSFVIERWQRDRDVFVSTAQDLGAEVNVQNANGIIEEQISQIRYFIDNKMDVIVVIPIDSKACTQILKKAKNEGIIVIDYDRLVNDSNADLYISFDNVKVGKLMAETLAKKIPYGGNIVTVFGPTIDHNVLMLEQGFTDSIKNTKLNVIYNVYADNWLAEEAFDAVNKALTINSKLDGILCANDDLASQAVRALSENRLAGKVVVTGQDADLAACQRIVEGTQTMTVYKPVDTMAKTAAEYAVKLVKGEKIEVQDTINDGSYNVPFVKLEPIAVTRDNIDEVIIKGGFQKKEEVYLNVP